MAGLSSGDGYTVLGVTLEGPPPLGRIHLDLQPGLSVLYGKNGVGKTRLLSALTAALRGYAFEGSHGVIHLHVEDVTDAPEPDDGFLGSLLDSMIVGAHRDLSGFASEVEVPIGLGLVDRDRASFEHVVQQCLESEESNWESWDLAAGQAACFGYFSLRAVGDVQPLWEVWISDQLREGDLLHEAFSAAETSARWFADFQRDIGPKGVIPDVQGRIEEFLRDFPGVAGDLSRISPWSFGAPPLLDLVQDFHFVRPTWVTAELRRIGSTTYGPLRVILVDEAEPDLDGETAQRLAKIGDPVFSDDVPLSDKALALITSLEGHATATFNSWVGPQSTLKFRLGTSREWFLGEPPAWMCEDEHRSAVPVSNLSHGRQRWAVAAIRLALTSE